MVDSRAAVDSELSLLLWKDYPREAWIDNPLLWLSRSRRLKAERQFGRTLMTSRIDGPTVESVMRLVLNAIAAEGAGLTGTLYIDAGAKRHEPFEISLLDLADGVSNKTKIPVVQDTSIAVFAPNTCPDAALYAGWYSPREYVPAFTWRPGAVAYHLSEVDAQDLRNPRSRQWVPRMIAEGVAATVGAAEPTAITALPSPGWFMSLVLSGEITVCEAYWRTIPNVSWRIMLVADPLYNPFKNNPWPLGLPAAMLPEATD
jgi:uncharacterized protein (TIGR03790 family)